MSARPLPRCGGFCNQGRAGCDCQPMPAEACTELGAQPSDPYADELLPGFVRWIDTHPTLAAWACIAFLLLVLGIGGFIDHGAL